MTVWIAAAAAVLVVGWLLLARRRGWRIPIPSWAAGGRRCHRCRSGYRLVRPHAVVVPGLGRVTGILCERCWDDLRYPDRRIPYYEKAAAREIGDAMETEDLGRATRVTAQATLVLRAVRDGG